MGRDAKRGCFSKADRFVPVASVPYGIVYSFTDDSAGNVWMSHQEGLFQLFGARVVNSSPGPGSGARNRLSLYCMMRCKVVSGLDSWTAA